MSLCWKFAAEIMKEERKKRERERKKKGAYLCFGKFVCTRCFRRCGAAGRGGEKLCVMDGCEICSATLSRYI